MKGLNTLFAVKDGGDLSTDDTASINAVLFQAAPSDIPGTQVQNVMDYINAQLLHNQVDATMRPGLEKLFEQLKAQEQSA